MAQYNIVLLPLKQNVQRVKINKSPINPLTLKGSIYMMRALCKK